MSDISSSSQPQESLNPHEEIPDDESEPEMDSPQYGSSEGDAFEMKEAGFFEGEDTLLPPFTTPPNDYLVESYSALYNYFIQSPILFDCFQQRFSLNPSFFSADLLEDGPTLAAFLKTWENKKFSTIFRSYYTASSEELEESIMVLSTMNPRHEIGMGECLFIDILTSSVKAKFERPEGSIDEILKYAKEWIGAIRKLKYEIVNFGENVCSHFRPAIQAAFSTKYLDPFNAVEFYIQKLQQWMTDWQKSPLMYNAPYTSMINSSMMGKSRLIKEIAVEIPMLYICLRESDDGYPPQSSTHILTYIKNPPYLAEKSLEVNENRIQFYFLALFFALLENIYEWCSVYDHRNEDDRKRLRNRLWYHLAEPGKGGQDTYGANKSSLEDSEAFWQSAVRKAQDLMRKKETATTIMEKFVDIWQKLAPYLSVKGGDPMLLIVWDEARTLVNTAINGGNDGKLLSMFRLGRRALRIIGRHGTPPTPLRIFSIFTDTSSRLGNFQPRGDTDSSRLPIEDDVSSRMFRPINLIPGIDAAAIDLSVTCKPFEVKHPGRLIKFGRPAWHVMAQEKPGYDLRDLAMSKLLRTSKLRLQSLFTNDNRDDVTLKMLACICSRLAIHTGAYVTATKELVASHMMPLERVGQNHDQLETRYLSEPILAEVAAEATATYGWSRPLETLLSEMRLGVVLKGYRDEFITKVLLCMAMEDAQKAFAKKKTDEGKKIKGWPFSQVVGVREFLNALFRNPLVSDKDQSSDASDPTPSTTRKCKMRNDGFGSPTKSKKVQSFDWDDLTSDDEKEISEPDLNEDPVPDRVTDYLENEALLKEVFGRQRDKDSRKRFLLALYQGHVFFNHFIGMETAIRPSTLVKAWNRGAALMTRVGTIGVDFIIPVMYGWKLRNEEELGPMFGEWSDECEQSAAKVIGYILIQTKNRRGSSPGIVNTCLTKCIPITSKDREHPVPSFTAHNPSNPFVSILMELGYVREGEHRVQVINTTDYKKLEKRKDTFIKKKAVFYEELSSTFEKSKQQKATEMELLREEIEIDNERDRLQIREQQLPIVAYGLNAETYKCLEGRGSVIRTLNELLNDVRNPVRGLKDEPVSAALIRMGHHLSMHPRRESIFHGKHPFTD